MLLRTSLCTQEKHSCPCSGCSATGLCRHQSSLAQQQHSEAAKSRYCCRGDLEDPVAGAQSGTSSTGTMGKPNPQQARSATRLDMYTIQGLEWGSTCIVCYKHDVPGVKPHARHIHPCREQPPPIVADIQHIPAGSCRSAEQPDVLTSQMRAASTDVPGY